MNEFRVRPTLFEILQDIDAQPFVPLVRLSEKYEVSHSMIHLRVERGVERGYLRGEEGQLSGGLAYTTTERYQAAVLCRDCLAYMQWPARQLAMPWGVNDVR